MKRELQGKMDDRGYQCLLWPLVNLVKKDETYNLTQF